MATKKEPPRYDAATVEACADDLDRQVQVSVDPIPDVDPNACVEDWVLAEAVMTAWPWLMGHRPPAEVLNALAEPWPTISQCNALYASSCSLREQLKALKAYRAGLRKMRAVGLNLNLLPNKDKFVDMRIDEITVLLQLYGAVHNLMIVRRIGDDDAERRGECIKAIFDALNKARRLKVPGVRGYVWHSDFN